jgi:hypothetical protein
MNAAWEPEEHAEYERHLATVSAALGEVAFTAAWAEGSALPLDDAIAYALQEAGNTPSAR